MNFSHQPRLVLSSVLLSINVLAGTGCAAELLNVTSGEIGCPREEITVRDGRSGWSSRSWTAECRGQTYYCSGSSGNVECQPARADGIGEPTPELAESPSAGGEERVGCHYDTQCKGERVCVQGACVTPEAPAASAPHAEVARRSR